MPLDQNRPGFIRRTLRYRKYSTKVNRSATLLIAVIAMTTAIVFSVSVKSRSAGWLWKSQPSAPSSSNPEPAKTSTVASSSAAASTSHRPLGPNAAPLVPTIAATKQDSLFTDVDGDGKADPGDTLKYTVSIGATGEDATAVQFTDTVDPNTTFVGGTLAASSVAVNDTFPVTVTGNVRINSANLAAPFSVTANDYLGTNPNSTISTVQANSTIVTNTITTTSANGGDIVMTVSGADMGKFTYNPPAGFTGTDTFTYTLSDNANVTSA